MKQLNYYRISISGWDHDGSFTVIHHDGKAADPNPVRLDAMLKAMKQLNRIFKTETRIIAPVSVTPRVRPR